MKSFPPSLPSFATCAPRLRKALRSLEAEQARRAARNRLATYRPYRKQAAFHAAGAVHRERLFMAGNQLGKTMAGAAEWAMHLTGRYPDWWVGKRFAGPVKLWAAGVTAESTRDNPQRMLLGPPQQQEEWGTRRDSRRRDRQRHAGARRGRRHRQHRGAPWLGRRLDPAVQVLREGPREVAGRDARRRLVRRGAAARHLYRGPDPHQCHGGIVIVTFTPLLGMSEVVRMFLNDDEAKGMT